MLQPIHIKVLLLIAMLTQSCQLRRTQNSSNDLRMIYTVQGSMHPKDLGFTLTHEHIMSNFGGEANVHPNYDRDKLLMQVIPYLRKVRRLGIESILDCTTAYFGRDVKILKDLADSTGLQIITNTGYYGAANDRYVPPLAYDKTKDEIANIWIEEFKQGIDGTDIRPGFIKLAFDKGTPSEIDLKLFEAGILAHKSTGLTMAVHTGDNPQAAYAQLALLKSHNVHPGSWVWVHANKLAEDQTLIDVAKSGAWISLDGVKERNIEEYVNRIKTFKRHGLLGQLLLSHDGNAFPRGKAIRPFDAISRWLIPRLEREGFSEFELDLLVRQNPKRAFEIKATK